MTIWYSSTSGVPICKGCALYGGYMKCAFGKIGSCYPSSCDIYVPVKKKY